MIEGTSTPVVKRSTVTAILSDAEQRSRIAFDSTGLVTPAAVDLYRSDGHVRVVVDIAGSIRLDAAQR